VTGYQFYYNLYILFTNNSLFTVDGSALLVLASCTTPRPARLIADWIRRLSWWVFSREESLAIVREFYENGLFLAAREQTGTMAP
jgi:hypothetical protein